MSYEEVLRKRIDILCSKQVEGESAHSFYFRVRRLRDEHRSELLLARENYKELFETKLSTEESAIIGYTLGIKIEIRRYLRAPCEYKNLAEAAKHASRIERRVRKLKLPIIFEENEKLNLEKIN